MMSPSSPVDDPIGTVRRSVVNGKIFVKSDDHGLPVWNRVYGADNRSYHEKCASEALPDSVVIGAVPGTPAADVRVTEQASRPICNCGPCQREAAARNAPVPYLRRQVAELIFDALDDSQRARGVLPIHTKADVDVAAAAVLGLVQPELERLKDVDAEAFAARFQVQSYDIELGRAGRTLARLLTDAGVSPLPDRLWYLAHRVKEEFEDVVRQRDDALAALKKQQAFLAAMPTTQHITHTVAVALRHGLLEEESPVSDIQTGAALIATERVRQIEVEGWTLKHDVEHTGDDLSRAAACYALPYDWRDPHGKTGQPPHMWPWRITDWKPTDRIRDLVKAGALIAAEIDRLQAQQGEQ